MNMRLELVDHKLEAAEHENWHETARWTEDPATGERQKKKKKRGRLKGHLREAGKLNPSGGCSWRRRYMMFLQTHQTSHLPGQGEVTKTTSMCTEWNGSILPNIDLSKQLIVSKETRKWQHAGNMDETPPAAQSLEDVLCTFWFWCTFFRGVIWNSAEVCSIFSQREGLGFNSGCGAFLCLLSESAWSLSLGSPSSSQSLSNMNVRWLRIIWKRESLQTVVCLCLLFQVSPRLNLSGASPCLHLMTSAPADPRGRLLRSGSSYWKWIDVSMEISNGTWDKGVAFSS